MTDTAFRTSGEATANPLADFPDVSKATSESKILATKEDSAGIFTSEAVKGYPMTVDNFELKTFWDSPTANMQDSIREVDSWVQEKARERNLTDSKESYKEIIDEVLNQIGKSDNEKPQKTFERVAKAVEAYKRLQEAKLPPVLDVNSMTPDEYKKTRA